MSKLHKSILAFALLGLTNFVAAQDQVYMCSPDMIEQTCPVKQNYQVCALNQNSLYQTYPSACEVCKLGHVKQFTNGECQCPKVKCQYDQTCFQGVCVTKQHFKQQDAQGTIINLYNAGEYKAAVKIINRQIQKNPARAYLFYLKANCNQQLKNNKQALKNIKSAIQRSPQRADYYVLRGKIMTQLKMLQQGMKQYEKAKSLGYKDLGEIYYYEAQNLLADKKNQESLKKFQDAIDLHPTKVQWYLRKAMAHMIHDEHAMGLITLKQAKKHKPTERQLYEINALAEQFSDIRDGQDQKLYRKQQYNEQLSTGKKSFQPRIEQDSQGNVRVLNEHGQPIPVRNQEQKKPNTQQVNLDQPTQQVEPTQSVEHHHQESQQKQKQAREQQVNSQSQEQNIEEL